MIRIEGAPISPGISVAPPLAVRAVRIVPEKRSIRPEDIDHEYARFLAAVASTKEELLELLSRTAEEIGESEAEIFDAHILVLEDPLLHFEVSRKLEGDRLNVESVLAAVVSDLSGKFSGMRDDVMRERAADVADVGERVIRHLTGHAEEAIHVEEPSILVATEISPSTAASLNSDMVLGFVTEVGSTTSHTAILSRALGIPAVVVPPGSISQVQSCSVLIVDGLAGIVIGDPDEATRAAYEEKSRVRLEHEIALRSRTTLDAITSDGVRVDIAANLEIPSEIAVARERGSNGVGLFRTEFLFMNRKQLPDEDEQYHHYRVVAEAFHGQPVVIRTIDIGGDKFLSNPSVSPDMNPYLGLRAIRFSLKQPDLFRVQLRAILRASRHGNVKVMFPMIACIEEVSASMAMLSECATDVGLDPNAIDVGVMIETPASALIAETLGRYLDFFSIGTNDLIQYTMAAERGNEQLAYLHRPDNPAVLHLIARAVAAAGSNGIGLSVCGEMAGDLRMVPLLVGLGVVSLSINPRQIPVVKEMIRRISLAECVEAAKEVSASVYASDAARIMDERFGARVRELEELL
jgi:phosphoenolpyruvate-protein phosphotransferase (PTS system enzyme I)